MGLFNRSPKQSVPVQPERYVIAFEVQFERGGRLYVFVKTLPEFQQMLQDRYDVRGELPHAVTAVFSDGSRENMAVGKS